MSSRDVQRSGDFMVYEAILGSDLAALHPVAQQPVDALPDADLGCRGVAFSGLARCSHDGLGSPGGPASAAAVGATRKTQ